MISYDKISGNSLKNINSAGASSGQENRVIKKVEQSTMINKPMLDMKDHGKGNKLDTMA
jgi:hypothetical protein